MKICEECITCHVEIVEESRKKGLEITECCFEECEVGHPLCKPELPEELQSMTDKMKEKTDHLGSSLWGWVYLSLTLETYYWWLRYSDLTPGYCSTTRPSDSEVCDIHYEPWIWVRDVKAWFGGLVNFGGCRPARNCGGDGGQVNSKRKGKCLEHYKDAPEVWNNGWLWCSYANTEVTDCIFRTQYMILDYYPVKERGLFEMLRKLFGLS